MNTEAIEILNAVCEKIGIAIDWTGENVMPQLESLIDQYARYLLVSNIVGLIMGIVFFACGLFLLRATYKSYIRGTWAKDDCGEITCTAGLAIFAGLFLTGLGFYSAICCTDDLIKSITIPQIYAAQQLLQMIQQ